MIPALGQPKTSETLFPAAVALPGRATATAAGAYHSVALLEDGSVFTFGAAQLGQLGRPTSGATDSAGLPVDATPRPVELPSPAVGVGAAFYNTFARCRDGGVYGAGENQYQQLGALSRNVHAMTRIAELDGEPIEEMAGGYCHCLFRTTDGRVLTTGAGDDGQRGDGADDEARPTVSLAALPVAATRISAGANHSLALTADGDVYAWGSNEHGELGLGDDVDAATTPARVPRPPDGAAYVAVSAGYAHSVLTDARGRAWAVGSGDNGQLARAADEDAATPVRCDPIEPSGIVEPRRRKD